MAFRFSLATVLRLREIAEEREERLLGQILTQMARARESLTDLQAQQLDSIRRREVELTQQIAVAELHVFYGEIKLLGEKQQLAREQIEKLEALRVQQTKVYELAHQARELLSGMREEQLDAFEYERGRKEQGTLDDNFSSRRALSRQRLPS
jgi:flagellar export protein FliJ